MPQHSNTISRMQQNMNKSVTPTVPLALDDEIAGEADEPPDEPYICGKATSSDSDFVKHDIRPRPTKNSLLTEALLLSNPSNNNSRRPADTRSTSSYWSLASNIGLTSDDGSTNVSRSPSPRPHPPMVLQSKVTFAAPTKPNLDEVGRRLEIVEAAAEFPRKRCITFACNPPSRRNSNDHQMTENTKPLRAASPAPPLRKPSTIKFACAPREQRQNTTAEETKPALALNNRKGNLSETPKSHSRRDSQSTVTAESPRTVTKATPIANAAALPKITAPKFYEFASSVDEPEAWMTEVTERKRLLKVDDLLLKEKKIQKLSREVEEGLDEDENNEDDAEAEDEDENGDDDDDDEEVAEDNEDEDEEQDDEDEDFEDNMSGNESDIEDGFETDSDTGSLWYFGTREGQPQMFGIPLSRRTSEDHHSHIFEFRRSEPLNIRPSTPDLPDSTDFVCGTLDEDRPLEEAYMQSVEERRNAKRFVTPQDIDPSFPESEPEDEDDDADDYPIVARERSPAGSWIAANMSSDGSHSGRRSRTLRSPPPQAVNITLRPPTATRRHLSPPPPIRRNSRHLSPPPPRATTRPIPHSPRPEFARTKSLPRPGAMFKLRKAANNNTGRTSTATSPRTSAVPIRPTRGALDIFKGLEKKRERRKAHHARERRREEGILPGEGEEKMRILGLGKAAPPAQWVISV